MEKIVTVILFLCITTLYSQEVELRKVRFIINDIEYIWDLENDILDDLNSEGSEPRFIASFFNFKPGDITTQDNLEKEIEHFKLRLKDSGLFYSAQVSIVPPRRYPNRRTIVVRVTDGFKYRFGGGYAYGFFGNMNLGGRGDYILLAGGLNNNLVDYRKNVGLGRVYFGNKLYINPLDSFGYNSIYAGYKITPDISLGVDIKGNYRQSFFPSGGVVLNINKYLILGDSLIKYSFEGYGEAEYAKNRITPNYTISISARYIPKIPISFLVQGDYSHRDSELFLGSYFFYHFDSILLPPIDLKLSPFMFWEFWETRGGVGLEIYFDVPIFTKFTLSYGWDLQGNGNFVFK